MSDPVDMVDDRTSKVISWESFVLCPDSPASHELQIQMNPSGETKPTL